MRWTVASSAPADSAVLCFRFYQNHPVHLLGRISIRIPSPPHRAIIHESSRMEVPAGLNSAQTSCSLRGPSRSRSQVWPFGVARITEKDGNRTFNPGGLTDGAPPRRICTLRWVATTMYFHGVLWLSGRVGPYDSSGT